jgi:hypothetical protein
MFHRGGVIRNNRGSDQMERKKFSNIFEGADRSWFEHGKSLRSTGKVMVWYRLGKVLHVFGTNFVEKIFN